MKGSASVWFRIGAALERARLALPGSDGEDSPPRKRKRSSRVKALRKEGREGRREARKGPAPRRTHRRREEDRGSALLDALLHGEDGRPSPLAGLAAAGTGTVALRLAQRLAERRRPPVAALVAAAGAGAGAGLLRELVLAVAERETGELDESLVEAVLTGAGEGMAYAALVEPWLPDSPWVQGVLLGSAGYVAAPWGGVGGLLKPLAPQRSLPVLGRLLESPDEARDRSFLEHLGYGVTLALLYHLLARR
jgi:hypothetical protein